MADSMPADLPAPPPPEAAVNPAGAGASALTAARAVASCGLVGGSGAWRGTRALGSQGLARSNNVAERGVERAGEDEQGEEGGDGGGAGDTDQCSAKLVPPKTKRCSGAFESRARIAH
jgi:hypothetical protein